MRLKTHFIASLLLFVGLYPHYRYWALLVFVGGFLIDTDHYLYYIIKKRRFSLKKAHKFFTGKIYPHVFCFFHHFEFILILFAAGFLSKYIMLVAIGASVHFAMDLINVLVFRDIKEEIGGLSWIWRLVGRR